MHNRHNDGRICHGVKSFITGGLRDLQNTMVVAFGASFYGPKMGQRLIQSEVVGA